MLQNLTGWHALVILAVIVLIFGAAKLPALAKSVGESMRILKSEVAENKTQPHPAAVNAADGLGSHEMATSDPVAMFPATVRSTVPGSGASAFDQLRS